MARLNLLLMDPEVDYLKALADYIREENPGEFRVFTFSNAESLDAFLMEKKEHIDAVMYNAVFSEHVHSALKPGVAAICMDDGRSAPPGDSRVVSKYSRADVLVRELLTQCRNTGIEKTAGYGREKKAALTAFISASGGSGRTTIALGMCMCLADMGQKVLYLCLENISSVPAFFDVTPESSFTHILFGSNEGFGGLLDRIRRASVIDGETSIRYISPPENSIELDGINPDELTAILACIKNSGLYDAVVLDFPAGLTARSLAALELCEVLFFVTVETVICNAKTAIMLDELRRIGAKDSLSLADRIRFITNMHQGAPVSSVSASFSAPALSSALSSAPASVPTLASVPALSSASAQTSAQASAQTSAPFQGVLYEPVMLPYEPALIKLAGLRGMESVKPFYNGIYRLCRALGFTGQSA